MASITNPHFHLISTQTALAFIVPQHLQAEVNCLRQIHDKAFSKWHPHINILYPFIEPSRLPSAILILRQKLQEIEPIQLKTSEVGVFRHRRNATVFLKPNPESEESLCSLRSILVQALGCEDKDGTHDGTFRPHMTIGQAGLLGNSVEQLVGKVEKLFELMWNGNSLAVLRRGSSGEMKIIEELSLGAPEKKAHIDDKMKSSDIEWRDCYSFSRNVGWRQNVEDNDMSPSQKSTSASIRVSTYNLMADKTAPSFKSRLPFIMEAVSSANDSTSAFRVLCFQEVNDEMLPLLLSDLFIMANFPFSTHMPSSLLPSHRNLLTLSSQPFKYHSLSFSERHKTALIALFDTALEVANVHFTSALTDKAVETKFNQMKTLTDFLHLESSTPKKVIVAGDFNLTTSSSTIQTALSRGLITLATVRSITSVVNFDIWDDTFSLCWKDVGDHEQGLFAGEEGATFDRLTNPLAAMSDSPIENRPERYDRVLIRKGDEITVEDFQTFGQPNEEGFCGSDHFGVCVTLRIGDIAPIEAMRQGNSQRKPEPIHIVTDSTDLQPLLEPYLPTENDREQRRNALKLLQETLKSSNNTSDVILATLGSYLMETYFPESDVDVLAIGSIPPEVFFDLATTKLRMLTTDEFRGVHFVNSLVSIVEVSVLGIKFDVQYCQAPELLGRYHSTDQPDLKTLVFDSGLISTLSPSSIRPLNTFRDAAYLLNTLPDLTSYQTAHRYLSLYLKRCGLYSAKFGYLGGIHLSLMLNRIVKLVAADSSSGNDDSISSATMIKTFFTYYAAFNWAEDNITDPSLQSHKNTSRSPRDSILICSIHTPTARRNVASSCTHLTGKTLTHEFNLASERLQLADWGWCIRPQSDGICDFLNGFGAFIRVQIDAWDTYEIGGDRIRETIGSLESKFPRLLVSLGRVSGLDGRIWPARFRVTEKETKGKESEYFPVEQEFKGYYLVGVSAGNDKVDSQGKKLFTGKVMTVMREFETNVKESREFQGGNFWVSMELVPKRKILDMRLVLDERDWGSTREPRSTDITAPTQMATATESISAASKSTSRLPQKSHKTSLRPAQDIISRIHWDSHLSVEDFLIGYEDRFVGVKEIDLARWKGEQTDEEFIPMHRIVWVRRKGTDGEKVWDRRAKLDLIFGSGVPKKIGVSS